MNDGDTVVLIGNQDIVREQKRDPPPAIPDPLRGKFNAVNLHSLVSSEDRDVVLDSAFKEACLVMLRNASMVATINSRHSSNVEGHSTKGTGPMYIADAGAMYFTTECWCCVHPWRKGNVLHDGLQCTLLAQG